MKINMVERHMNAEINKMKAMTFVSSTPSTHTKTSVLFVEKNKIQKNSIFMSIAEKIGHNKNGKPSENQ